jgi:hypothetical protein
MEVRQMVIVAPGRTERNAAPADSTEFLIRPVCQVVCFPGSVRSALVTPILEGLSGNAAPAVLPAARNENRSFTNPRILKGRSSTWMISLRSQLANKLLKILAFSQRREAGVGSQPLYGLGVQKVPV